MNNFNAIEAKNECIAWIRDWFEHNGKDCNAIIGISGGADSSIVAALCVEALGKERVIGVMMPDGHQEDLEDSVKLCNFLDINAEIINIGPTVDVLMSHLYSITLLSQQARINLPPRVRMTTLYAISQSKNGRVANTCNLSEDYIGYSTRWGDSVGDFSPLANFTKTEVVTIGDACGLPRELTHKTPSDGLCGKTDEDNFGFTYEVLDKYIRTGECEDKLVKEKIDKLHTQNLFKTRPIASFDFWWRKIL